MAPSDLVVSLDVDETAVLPETPSVEALLASPDSCRTQLLPKIQLPASALSKGTVGAAGGVTDSDKWDPDPIITMRSVHLFKIRGAHYFPDYGDVIDRQGRAMRSSMGQASYVTPDLLMLPHIQRRDGQIVFSPPQQSPQLPCAAVTMPWGARHNYGHFVIDCLSSIPCLQGLDGLPALDWVFPTLQPWHRDHLRLLDVSPVELAHGHVFVEELFFTNCMQTFLQSPNRNLRLVPDRQRAALGCGHGGNRKIYLSRRGVPKRTLLSEERLESILIDRGFEIVQAQTLSVADQIALFASASVVVGSRGAAFANALYCAPGTTIVVVEPRPADLVWLRNICVMMGLRWAPYFCDSQAPEKVVVHGGIARPTIGITYDIDFDDFLAHLDKVVGH